jgi:dTDP-4-amino-4,6-dideoxygalactose transaminase
MIPVQRPSIGKEELDAVGEIFESGWLGMGSKVKEFEDEIKQYLDVTHAIAVNSGTSALHIALDCCGVGLGDEVIVPSLTFVASIQAIINTGAIPVFCEVNPKTLNIDIQDMVKKITIKTKAIMPVHYGGLPCDMDSILSIAHKQNIVVVEDAAHAFGSNYKGKMIGSVGDLTCFSFDPIKNITCGEGGVVVTNNDQIAEELIRKRILGIEKDTWSRYKNERSWFYDVTSNGFRYHMSNINAAIGIVQLKKFPEFNQKKKAIIASYDKAFQSIAGLELLYRNHEETAPFFYIIKIINGHRDKLIEYLKENGIGSGVHYIPNHLQFFFKNYSSTLPVTEKVGNQIITLPLYYDMEESEVKTVTKFVLEFMQNVEN